MTGLITKAALLSACGMLVASAAMAGIPSPGNCTVPIPAFIRLVGNAAGVPDSTDGKFTVIVRDLANNPINGSNVVIDLSACATSAGMDLQIASNQFNVNYTTNCTGHTVSAYTDASGTVSFTLIGNSVSAVSANTGLGCARIIADGVLLESPTVSAFDLNGASGVEAGDLAMWRGDAAAASYRGRADYNGTSSVEAGDLAIWRAVAAGGRSVLPTATPCTP